MAKIKEFKCGYGVSFEKRGIWYKVGYEQTIEVEDGNDSKELKEDNWNQVTAEVENQIDEILKSQEGE
ncbi:MAG: hypothetical protein ACOC22_02115 [bacterium]